MRALLQRVSRASVEADGQTVGAIGPGLLVLLGVRRGDTQAEADTLYQRYAQALVAAGVTEVATGRFGAMMQVSLVNDGPVTVLLEREAGG